MNSPVTVAELRDRARRMVERSGRRWAATADYSTRLEVPLHPPTERSALTDLEAARAWVASWRAVEDSPDIELTWAVRNWARIGSQRVPERAVVHGAESIARVGRVTPDWARVRDRLTTLRGVVGTDNDALAVLQARARVVVALDDDDFERLLGVLSWLREHPASGRLVRELPIRGIDTKWIESRRGLVESLHRAATGAAGLGLAEPEPLVRLRILDPRLAVGGLTDVTAPVGDLAALPLTPERVYVFENLATVLAMPDVRGAVVLDGGGQRVELVARLPWAREVTYWGDLDSHGFAILHRLRSHGVTATSALMDSDTLYAHRDLWGRDPEPNVSVLGLLKPDEQVTLTALSAEGNVRLEQERIPWEYALDRLTAT